MRLNKILTICILTSLLLSCASTKTNPRPNLKELQAKVDFAIQNCEVRSKKECEKYLEDAKSNNAINSYSEELYEFLLKNNYTEIANEKIFCPVITKIFVEDYFYDIYDPLTSSSLVFFKLNGYTFYLDYYSKKNIAPNFLVRVYMWDEDNNSKVRTFYKVNYEMKYVIFESGPVEGLDVFL